MPAGTSSLRSRLSLALALSLGAAAVMVAVPERAAAVDPMGDLIARDGNGLTFRLTTDRPVRVLDVVLQPGVTIVGEVTPREPGAICAVVRVDRFSCEFHPAVPAGQTRNFDFATEQIYISNEEDAFAVCQDPCDDPSDLSPPFEVNGPDRTSAPPPGGGGTGPSDPSPAAPKCAVDPPDRPGPAPCADLFAHEPSIIRGELAEAIVKGAIESPGEFPDTVLPVRFRVTNFGPDDAHMVRLSPGGGVNPWLWTCPSLLVGGPRFCEILGVGRTFTLDGWYPVSDPGARIVTVAASSITRDPGPRPNTAELEVEASGLPDSGKLKFTPRIRTVIAQARSARSARPQVTGRARNARTVYVAIARRQDGARVQSSAAGCAWLRNTRGQVRRERGRRCDEPIWLRARGRSSWRLALRRPLPPGSYTILSRAVAASGVTEAAFSRRDGNSLNFRVGRR